jgi:Tol biopolymer transport system component
MAQPFNLRGLTLTGEPRPVADRIELSSSAQNGGVNTLALASFSASPNGVLVWRRNSLSSQSSLQWFDRGGKKLSTVGEPANYSNPSLSPDNTKLAVCIRDPQTNTRDIWVLDLLRGSSTRLTFDPADDLDPVWSPDGTHIAFSSNRAGQRDIYWKLADGSGQEEQLLVGGKGPDKNVEDWSTDGKYLIYNYGVPNHLYVLPLAGDRKPVPFMDIRFYTNGGQFSPNGRWVAYRSLEAGKPEIFVQGFNLDPSQPRGKWQVSTAGGELPRWRRDGKELFYHYGEQYFAVDVKTDGKIFEAGVPKPLFSAATVASSASGGSPFVVTKDGQRFLVLAQIEKQASQPLDVLVNWR